MDGQIVERGGVRSTLREYQRVQNRRCKESRQLFQPGLRFSAMLLDSVSSENESRFRAAQEQVTTEQVDNGISGSLTYP